MTSNASLKSPKQKVIVDILDEQNVRVPKNKLKRIIRMVIEKFVLGRSEVSVYIVDEAKMRELNQDYRKVDQPTDVLSFPMLDSQEEIAANESLAEITMLGDIVLCPKYISGLVHDENKARSLDTSGEFEMRMLQVAVHGALHLIGFDHEAPNDNGKMKRRENQFIKSFSTEWTVR